MRDRLIQQRERVADRAFRGARDQSKCGGLDLDTLHARDRFQMLHQQIGIHATQIESADSATEW